MEGFRNIRTNAFPLNPFAPDSVRKGGRNGPRDQLPHIHTHSPRKRDFIGNKRPFLSTPVGVMGQRYEKGDKCNDGSPVDEVNIRVNFVETEYVFT